MESRCTCCDGPLGNALSTPEIVLLHCRGCGTWAAQHLIGAAAADVWRGETVTPEYLEALLRRRRRQAHEIVARVQPFRDRGRFIDYGCGHGVFLHTLLGAGFDAYGCDLSPSVVESFGPDLRSRVSLVASPWALPEGRFETFCMLDVLEHCDAPREFVARLREAGVEVLIVKVPVAGGPLFRLARALVRMGRTGPIEHLFLVGESAPHLSYFSARGLVRLFERCGFRTLRCFRLAEVGPELAVRLRSHAGRGHPLGGALLGLAGGALERIAPAWSDTAVFIGLADGRV